MPHRIGVDIGGTFTDFALFDEHAKRLAIHKQLTTPADPSQAVLEGIVSLLERERVDIESVKELVHGTTLVTNSVIERKGARTGMLTTAGFFDLLDIGHEKRYDVFDLRITFPDPLVPRALRREAIERVCFDGTVEKTLDLSDALDSVQELVEQQRIDALAICFLHAYANPSHEVALRDAVIERFPDIYVSTSHEIFAGRREFDRFTTTSVNSFTGPMFDRYLTRLQSGLQEMGFGGRWFVMSSSGGTLTPAVARRFPVRVVESGPAAGVQMSVFHGQALNIPNLLSFDMGGTTAKGALVRAGTALKVYELEVARQHEFKAGSGLPLRTPVIDMIEIGAGGGSIAHVDARGTIKVGPQSAGAAPGPVCYGQGGTAPTLTDANLSLGYLDDQFFLGGSMRLDADAASRSIEQYIAQPLGLDTARAAFGIHEIISEDVARAFRVHASERGFDYRNSSMIAFGGSGPIHAIGIARKLGIPRVIFPVAAGVMSALGLLASPLAFEVAQTYERFVRDLDAKQFDQVFSSIEEQATKPLLEAGVPREQIEVSRRLDMRYQGQGHEIEVSLPAIPLSTCFSELEALFKRHYETLYAFAFLDAPLVISTWKVEVKGPAAGLQAGYALSDANAVRSPLAPNATVPGQKASRRAYFGEPADYVETAVIDRYALREGDCITGPALIEERESTSVIPPGSTVSVDSSFNLIAELQDRC